MKNLILKLTALLLLSITIGCAAAEGNMQQLELQIKDLYTTEQWFDSTSDTHDWLVVEVTATNWCVESIQLSDKIDAQLIVRDVYSFAALPSFETDRIDPLVQLNGALVFQIPKLASTMLDEARLLIAVDGTTIMDEVPSLSRRVGSSSGKHECDGFDSPAEAGLAYLEAFNAGSVQDMLSTFAIETYVDHIDRPAAIERMGSFVASYTATYPMPTAYMRNLLVAERYGDIASRLTQQYLTYAWPDAYDDYNGNYLPFNREEAGEIEAFLDAFEYAEFNEWIGNIEFIGFETPESLGVSELYYSESNQINLARQANCYGCDDIEDVVMRIRVNGEDYLQFLSCARYGDRWYVQEFGGNIAVLLALSYLCAGLAPAEIAAS